MEIAKQPSGPACAGPRNPSKKMMIPKVHYINVIHEESNPLYPYSSRDKKEFHAAIALRGWNIVATSIYRHEPKIQEFVTIPLEASAYAINDFLEEHEGKLIEAAKWTRRKENAEEIAKFSEESAYDIATDADYKLAEICAELQNAADEHDWQCPEITPCNYHYNEEGEPDRLLPDNVDPYEIDLEPMDAGWELKTIAESVAYALIAGIDDETRDTMSPRQIRDIEKFATEYSEPCLAKYNNGLDCGAGFTRCEVTGIYSQCAEYWVKKIAKDKEN